jgi:trans-aconitate methyltransferase
MNTAAFLDKTFTALPERCHYMTAAILQYVAPARPLRILDVGCGTGEQLLALANVLPAATLTGVDVSDANIQVAAQAGQQSPWGKRLTFVACDYLALQSPPFDLILSDSTLQNIAAPTATLFYKLAADLLPGGLLLATMPYACGYNWLLWTTRRLCRALRSPLTDAMLLALANRLHRGQFSEALLQERIHYMYLLPGRYLCHTLRQFLGQECGLQAVQEYPVPHVSPGQPKHRLAVFRKQG